MAGGYEQALSTKLLATHCIFCGRPLRDPQSVQRGYGPDCAEKYAQDFTHGYPPTDIDVAGTIAALEMAPDPLKSRWRQMGGSTEDLSAPWMTDPEIRREMLSVGLHYGAMAVSYGSDQLKTVRERVDAAMLTIVALQHFADAVGYGVVAQKIRDRFLTRLENQDHIRFIRSPSRPGAIGVHTPYNDQWLRVARGSGKLFYASERRDKFFFRYFHEQDLGQVINMLQGVFGDAFCINPEGQLILLPAMPLPEPVPKTSPAGPPREATDEIERMPAATEGLRIGDRVKLPDGSESTIQYLDPKKKRIGCGETKGRGYKFFSFSEVETSSGQQVARDVRKKTVEANRQEGFKEEVPEQKLPARIPDGIMPHQLVEVAFIEKHRRVIIGSEPGSGKTLVGAVAVEKPAIVVCPALLKVNWIRELARWRPDLSSALIEGSGEPDPITKNADVIVLNYDILAAHVEWLADVGARTLIADEAHYLKNLDVRWNKESRLHEADTKRSPQRAVAFYRLHLGIPKLVLMTGTPILNRTRELFPLLHMLNAAEWNSGYQFCVRYCAGHNEWIRTRGGGGRQVFNCDGRSNADELHQKLTARYMIRHTKAEVLKDLPPKSRRSMSVSLSAEYKKIYKRVANDFIKWVMENGGAERVAKVMRAQALVQLTKLRAVSAMGKVEAALDYISDFVEGTGRPLVVMAVHKEVFGMLVRGLDEINAAYEKAVAKDQTPEISRPIRYGTVVGGQSASSRQAVIDAFQLKGELDVLFYSIPIATGVTLTRAQDMLFIERMWRPADQVQGEDRCHRQGQQNALQIVYMDAEGTIDLKLGMLLMDKSTTAAAVIDGVDLSTEAASMLVFGEMFDAPEGFMDKLGDVLGDLAEPEDEDLSGLVRNPGREHGETIDRGTEDDDTYDADIDSSWNDPI
jgi:hypothetical protein